MSLTEKTNGENNEERCSQKIFENGRQKRYKDIIIRYKQLK